MNAPRIRGRYPLAIALAFFASASVLATTVTFRQGENAYGGCGDTFIAQNAPNNVNGGAPSLRWDGDDPTGTGRDDLVLLRFDNIIGGGPGQVPPGATISSATLTYVVSDDGDLAELHLALADWNEGSNFATYCGAGCDEDQIGALVGTATGATTGVHTADVKTGIQAWADGTANLGWIFVPTGTGGVDIGSSENQTPTNRPLLTIVYDEGPPPTAVVRQPYLQLATQTSVTLVWRTDVPTDSRVHYGTTAGTLDESVDSSAVSVDHAVTITGLDPATRYYYDVGSTTTVDAGGTAEHYFDTSPSEGEGAPFRVWVIGDSGNGGSMQAAVRDAMLAYVGTNPPNVVLHVGDIAYTGGTEEEFTTNHFEVYEDILRNTVSWTTLGNHEGSLTTSGDPGPSTGPYYDAFVLPMSAEAGGVPSGTEAYYSFDRGDVHFISLNSYQVSRSPTGPMATWLANDLASTDSRWIIAFWHHPPYSKGTHNSDADTELIEMRENLLPILEAGGVDLVLSGHSHGYERSYLIDGTYTTPTPSFSTLQAQGHILDDGDGRIGGDGAYQKPSGINAHEGAVFVVAGHGGASIGGALNHPVMYFSEAVNGSCILDVDASSITLTNIRHTGVVSDTFTLVKGTQSPQVQATSPAKGSVLGALSLIEVTFTSDVTGVDAGDLSVDGSQATTVSALSARDYVFTGFAPPGNGAVSVVLAAGGIVDAGDPGLAFAGDAFTYTIDTAPPRVAGESPSRGAALGALLSISVDFSKPVFGVDASDLLVNGQPATMLSGVPGSAGPYLFFGYPAPALGQVDVALLTGGIVDSLGQAFPGDAWTYAIAPRLVINEFLASNASAATDEFGEHDDYVEIYNPAPFAVDMGGMHLTDELDFPEQYRIPDGVVIPAKGYLVFWCDDQPTQGPLHTNFSLLRPGESIGLFDTVENELAPIDTTTWANARTDVSNGRFPDGAPLFVFMPPTLGATNTIDCVVQGDCAALNGPCAAGVCSSTKCVAQAVNEGGACDDGIGCLAPDACHAGACGGGVSQCSGGETCDLILRQCGPPPCGADAECDDGNACTDDVCAAQSCVHVVDDSNACSDGVACTADACSAGACSGINACPGGQVCDPLSGFCQGSPATTTFQDGPGYGWTQDTFLAQGLPTAVQGGIDRWRWDTENPAPSQEFGLVRFDNIIGSGLGQIPSGSTVAAATLTVVVWGSSTPPAGLICEASVGWSEAFETWNSFGGEPGVQTDEYWSSPQYTAPIELGPASIDVTASVDAWLKGTRTNNGWLFRPQSSKAAVVRSAEYSVPVDRPKLSVTYLSPASCASDPECDDASACNGLETCVASRCRAGSPLYCDDGDVCTDDSCSASGGCGHTPIQVPVEITGVSFDADKTTLRWDSASSAGPGTVHDVVRGMVSELPVGAGPGETCLATGVAAAATVDAAVPTDPAGFWYDVRARNACGIGTYGFVTLYGLPVSERTSTICP